MAGSNRISWFQTIRTKLITVIILTTTIVLGVAGYFAYKYEETNRSAELTVLAEVTAERLSRHLEIPMWDLDTVQVGKLLEAEMKEAKLAGIVIRDEDKKTLFSAKERTADGGTRDSEGSISGDFIAVDKPVLRGEETIGIVSVFLTPEFLREDLKQFGKGVTAIVIILDIIMFLIMGLVLGRVLIDPLRQLAASAERMSQGDLNQHIDINSNDEIGYLASTFNKMQSSLRVAIRRLTKQ